eukprot:TRINITY_DN6044_c0_g2_i1.p1 TRINITY_DN6044_c0_g2~~TRINITY_DN6044_c0_g2_i1.p1  ORF type:complete len:390 (+),score=56.93 TRINITY_DN6044_c0_g2_i1:99-1268(+)
MVSISFLLFLFLSLHVLTTLSVTLTVNIQTNRVEDDDGRERYFHGTNIVVKRFPWHPTTEKFDAQWSFVEEDMALLKSMGLNSIRLNVPWAGIEPVEGQYNYTLLKILSEIVEKAGRDYGIYTLLDFHQDALAEQFCGTGVPYWVSSIGGDNFPVPLVPRPIPVDPVSKMPNRSTCDSINGNVWPLFYFTECTSYAFGALYNNTNNLGDKFARFWGQVAKTWSASPYVLGYELMNEPWAGNVVVDPTLLIPGIADRRNLQPLWEKVAQQIRQYDLNHLIFFQAVTWEFLGIGEIIGYTDVPGGVNFRNKSILSFHDSVRPDITPDEKYYGFKKAEIARLGCGTWVTEVGSTQMEVLDEYGFSWMNWDYKWFANTTWDNPGQLFFFVLGW